MNAKKKNFRFLSQKDRSWFGKNPLEVHYWKKWFSAKKVTNFPFEHVFWIVAISANFFKLKLQKKFVRSLKRLILFWGRQQLERLHYFGKKLPNVVCTRKRKNWGFFQRSLAESLKFSRSTYMIQDTFCLGNKTKFRSKPGRLPLEIHDWLNVSFRKINRLFLFTSILHFWVHCQVLLFQTPWKIWSLSEKSEIFSRKEATRTFFCTFWMHFQKHWQNVFGWRSRFLISHSKKNVVFWEMIHQMSSAHKSEKMITLTVKFCSKFRGLLVKKEKGKIKFFGKDSKLFFCARI